MQLFDYRESKSIEIVDNLSVCNAMREQYPRGKGKSEIDRLQLYTNWDFNQPIRVGGFGRFNTLYK